MQNPAVEHFKRILRIVEDLFSIARSSLDFRREASKKYPEFPSLASYIAGQFAEERILDVVPRMKKQLEILEKYNPPVRPALDPGAAMPLGVYSRLFDDREVGFFMGYPPCCINAFTEELQIGFTKKHVSELQDLLKESQVLVVTAGFIPCSLKCSEALNRGLLAIVDESEISKLQELEKILYSELPHFHYEYAGHYYEYLKKQAPLSAIF